MTTRRPMERAGPEPPPDPGPNRPHPVDPPSVFPGGVELPRLIARAQLTPAQAVELAAAVASEAVRRSGPDGGAPDHQPVPLGPVLVGADGRVVPGPRGNGGPGPTSSAVGEVLAGIADAVRAHARVAGPSAEHLLAGLDGAVAELPDAGVTAAAGALQVVAGAIDRRTVRAEIGALVRAIDTDAGPVRGGPPAAAEHPAARATGRGGSSTGRRTRRRIGAWLLSAVVVAGLVLLEIGLLRGHIAADIGVLLDAGRGGSAASASASASSASAASASGGRPVVAPAPASAGPVAGVDLRALMPCTPGAPCSVRLQVRLTPGTAQQVVTWSYRLVDRCTGAASTAPGGSVTLPAGAQQASVIGTVALPAAPGVGLVAVTGQPAAAASAPLVVGTCPPHR